MEQVSYIQKCQLSVSLSVCLYYLFRMECLVIIIIKHKKFALKLDIPGYPVVWCYFDIISQQTVLQLCAFEETEILYLKHVILNEMTFICKIKPQ